MDAERSLDEEVVALKRRIAYLESALENATVANAELKQLRTDVEKMKLSMYGSNGTLGLVSIIYGSPELGVEGIRPILNRINTSYDRVQWLVALLGIPSLGAVLIWIYNLLTTMP